MCTVHVLSWTHHHCQARHRCNLATPPSCLFLVLASKRCVPMPRACACSSQHNTERMASRPPVVAAPRAAAAATQRRQQHQHQHRPHQQERRLSPSTATGATRHRQAATTPAAAAPAAQRLEALASPVSLLPVPLPAVLAQCWTQRMCFRSSRACASRSSSSAPAAPGAPAAAAAAAADVGVAEDAA
jgi:hypothetical protein